MNPYNTLPPRWEIKMSEDGHHYLWDDRKYDNYDLRTLCRILNEYEEKTNEVARLQQLIRNMQEIIDDDTNQKSKLYNEVARLREEQIQVKQKAKEWKEKYRKLDLSVRCEYCDPNGTIWECCTKRQYEQAAEIEELKSEITRLALIPCKLKEAR